MRILLHLALLCVTLNIHAQESPATKSNYRVQEFMVPMRDGVHLQTVVITKANQAQPLPILLTRTPYGVLSQEDFDKHAEQRRPRLATGQAGRNSPPTATSSSCKISVDASNPKAPFSSPRNTIPKTPSKPTKPTTPTTPSTGSSKTSPTTTARWASTASPTAGSPPALTLLHPHPALKAISEQASPVDQWMNDDDHRYGAFRESYTFEYAVMEQADKNKNTNFDFDTYDTYDWYLKAARSPTLNDKYLHGTFPTGTT